MYKYFFLLVLLILLFISIYGDVYIKRQIHIDTINVDMPQGNVRILFSCRYKNTVRLERSILRVEECGNPFFDVYVYFHPSSEYMGMDGIVSVEISTRLGGIETTLQKCDSNHYCGATVGKLFEKEDGEIVLIKLQIDEVEPVLENATTTTVKLRESKELRSGFLDRFLSI